MYVRVVVTFTDGRGTVEALPSTSIRINAPPTGTPSITGMPVVEQELMAVTSTIRDADNPANTNIDFSFLWQRSDNADFTNPMDIPSANSNTYELTGDDAGKYIRVRITFTDGATNTEMVFSRATARIAGGANLCDRTDQVETAILKLLGVSDCVPVTIAQLNGISGTLDLSDSSTLVSLKSGDFAGLSAVTMLTINDTGLTTIASGTFAGLTSLQTLSLVSNGIDSLPEDVFDGLTSLNSLFLSDTNIISLPEDIFADLTSLNSLFLNDNSIASLLAGIFEGLTMLQTLALNDNRINNKGLPAGVFMPIAGTLTRLDLQNNDLRAFPTNALSGLTQLSASGAQGLNIENNPDTGSPAFSIPYELVRTDGGTGSPATIQVRLPVYVPSTLRDMKATLAAVGGMLAVGSGTPAPSITVALDTNVTVTGMENLAAIVSATAPIHTPVRGMQIGNADNFRAIDGNTPASGQPIISGLTNGTAQVPAKLTAVTTGITDPDGPDTNAAIVFSYQWQSNTASDFISGTLADIGTNSKTYDLTDDDAGQYIRVRVRFTDGLNTEETLFSEATTAPIIRRNNRPATGTLTITGTSAFGSSLTSTQNNIADQDGLGTFTYQWQRSSDEAFTNPMDIGGATSPTYDLTGDDAGYYIRVRITFTDGATNTEMVFSRATARIAGGANLCDRTDQVETAILKLLGVSDCVPVTIAQLNGISGTLDLSNSSTLVSLKSGDFAGLSAVTMLTINDTGLATIASGTFAGLASLQTLSLVSNGIDSLPEDVFDGLTSLNSLILSDTNIISLPEDIFADLTSLNSLFLKDNSIDSLPEDVFEGLTMLQTLALNDNRIDSLPARVFTPLALTLTRLDLQGNNLSAFPTDALSVLTQLNASGAQGLNIENNPNTGSPAFSIPYQLERINGGTGSPATIQVHLPLYMPSSLRDLKAILSATNGTLNPTTVALDTNVTVTGMQNLAAFVSAMAPSHNPVRGMQIGSAENFRAIDGNTPATGMPVITWRPSGA